ncbi:MAG: transporter, ATP-binding protein [Candidatus Parcubacteria bacterium]
MHFIKSNIEVLWLFVTIYLMNDIIISNLSKSYTKKKATVHVVRDLSLSVTKGTVFGFIGPNGAGKTSTIKILVGLSQPTSGSVSICGGKPSDLSVRQKIGFMPESPTFYQYLTGHEFLDLIATLFDIKEKKKKIKAVLHDVDLLHAENKTIRTYSKGMLQRLGLAQAIINDPDVLFLDEPLDGLDPLGRAEVKKIILDLKSRGKTIFINTHILGDVEEICDMVGIIDKGILIRADPPSVIAQGYVDLEDAFVHTITERRQQSMKPN